MTHVDESPTYQRYAQGRPVVGAELTIDIELGRNSSDNVIHHVRDSGGRTQIYFDDFAVAAAWPRDWTPPASTVTRSRTP